MMAKLNMYLLSMHVPFHPKAVKLKFLASLFSHFLLLFQVQFVATSCSNVAGSPAIATVQITRVNDKPPMIILNRASPIPDNVERV